MVCLAGTADRAVVPAFLRHFIESEHLGGVEERLAGALRHAVPRFQMGGEARLGVLAVDELGQSHTFSSGGARVGPGSDLPVRIAARVVSPPRETPLQRLVRTPSIWGPAIAALAIFVLVSTAFATGTVRPAPPPVPTPRPGEPRPTADTRPSLSIGGFVLQPPIQPTPVPVSPAPAQAQAQVDDPQADGGDQPSDAPAPAEPPPCTNLLGIGCQPAAPPAPPVLPARPGSRATQPRVPVPSPLRSKMAHSTTCRPPRRPRPAAANSKPPSKRPPPPTKTSPGKSIQDHGGPSESNDSAGDVRWRSSAP